MPSYKLTYFNARARAEPARVLMAYGGIDYEDCRITKEEWATLKPTTPFGGLPMLEFDGVRLSQSTAIARFLAKKVGLHGKSDVEEAKIDMVVGCFEDSLKPALAIFSAKDDAEKEEIRKKVQDTMEDKMKSLERLMDGDYFVGNQMTWADIFVSEGLCFYGGLGLTVPLDKVPKLAALCEKVSGHPKIAAWIAKRPESSM